MQDSELTFVILLKAGGLRYLYIHIISKVYLGEQACLLVVMDVDNI